MSSSFLCGSVSTNVSMSVYCKHRISISTAASARELALLEFRTILSWKEPLVLWVLKQLLKTRVHALMLWEIVSQFSQRHTHTDLLIIRGPLILLPAVSTSRIPLSSSNWFSRPAGKWPWYVQYFISSVVFFCLFFFTIMEHVFYFAWAFLSQHTQPLALLWRKAYCSRLIEMEGTCLQ